MNRIDFTQAINYNEFESSVVAYFDQIMGLYNIIHDYDFNKINGEDNIAQFSIQFKSASDSKKAYETIPSTTSIYCRDFKIEKSIKGKSICIELIEG